MVAQQWLLHKTSKPSFVAVFWVTMLLKSSLFVLLHACADRHGVKRLKELFQMLQQQT